MNEDNFYYIMDYSGNYYRLNGEDELVVADVKDATIFTDDQIQDRLVGKKAAFYCPVPADGEAEINVQEESEDEYVSPVKDIIYEEVHDLVEKSVASYDLSEINWKEYLTHFTYMAEGAKEYHDSLTEKLSDVDQKICDILHYIELCETDAEEDTDLIELLRICRENRRNIKDEELKVEYFRTNLGTNANVLKAKQALKGIQGLENRKYKPRKYDELFENCVIKERPRERADYEWPDTNEERSLPMKKKCEVKIDTPYDGRENDWIAFARQQAEFYQYAKQYIANLQIRTEEIDQEIEEILQETEDAKCNVTQGYKVVKRIKELRVERRVKVDELQCLYALTDYVDCDKMAETCEENLIEIEDILQVTEGEQNDAECETILTEEPMVG